MKQHRQMFARAITVIAALFVVASVLSLAPSGVSAQEAGQETEPNDASVGGTPVTTEEVTGTLDPAGTDYDWYVIRADEGETIEATGNFDIPSDVSEFEMTIIAPNGSDLTSEQQDGSQVGVATVAPAAGLYYVGIQSTTTNTEIGLSGSIPYTLTITPTLDTIPASYSGSPDLADQPQSENEPNNARVGGAEIQNAPVNGSLEPTGDDDWFKIQAEAGQRIEATVTYENVGNDTNSQLELVAPDGTSITSVDEYDFPRLSVGAIAQQSGTYYVHLSANRAIGAMPYSLTAFAAGGQGNDSTDTETADATTSAGNNTSASTNGSMEYPPGFSASRVTDPSLAADRHAAALAAQNSYSLTLNATNPSGDIEGSVTGVQRASISSQQVYAAFNLSTQSGRLVTENYFNGSTAYRRTNTTLVAEGGPQYNVSQQPFSVSYNTTATSFQRNLGNASYEAAQPVERNGETLLRYEATELTDAAAFLNMPLSGITAENVSEFNATVLVGQDGVIRSLSYSATYTTEGVTTSKTLDLRITDLNATMVNEPEWLAEAKQNTSLQSTVTTTGQETETPAPPEEGPMTTTSTATNTATSTSTPIPTPTPSAAEAMTTDSTPANGTVSGGTTTGTSSSGAGFGIALALVALIAVALLAVRQ